MRWVGRRDGRSKGRGGSVTVDRVKRWNKTLREERKEGDGPCIDVGKRVGTNTIS